MLPFPSSECSDTKVKSPQKSALNWSSFLCGLEFFCWSTKQTCKAHTTQFLCWTEPGLSALSKLQPLDDVLIVALSEFRTLHAAASYVNRCLSTTDVWLDSLSAELAEALTVDIRVLCCDLGAATYLEPRLIVVEGCSLPLYLYTRYACKGSHQIMCLSSLRFCGLFCIAWKGKTRGLVNCFRTTTETKTFSALCERVKLTPV